MRNITRFRGDTYADEFVVISLKTGQPMNIAGYTFILTVDLNEEPLDATGVEYQVVGSITDSDNGVVEFVPTVGNVDRIGEYFYDVQMIDGASRKRTIEKGEYNYEQDITKD